MAKFQAFEEIEAWKKSYKLTLDVYWITSHGDFAKDYGLRDQIRRSSVSIMANIAEGHGRKSNYEFANFLNVARGSAQETQSHLYIAKGLGYISETDFEGLYGELTQISKMTLSLARYLRNSGTP